MKEIEEKLDLILRELSEIYKIAKDNNMPFLERNTLHLISHVQTLLESLKKSEAGFSIKPNQ
ncbi:MAG: hypothetical protein RQ952_07695 [Thermoproteota archaeon]|jgi:hypothetical protein|nr:hypothetical protein [Thermoproteota archaeon]